MHRTYTTIFVILTAAILVLACVLFAVAQHGHPPPPSTEARIGSFPTVAGRVVETVAPAAGHSPSLPR